MSDISEEEFDEDHAMDMVLNDMINKLRTVRVRFANESDYIVLNGFQFENFEKIEEFDKDVYGVYKGQHLMIDKEDYKNLV
jgi:molybdopterin-guanine dinucleotide biosynthesis protein